MTEKATLPGAPGPELLARVRDGLDILEHDGDAPGSAVKAAAVLLATRDAIVALESGGPDSPNWRALLHRILESAMHRPVRAAFAAAPFSGEWTDLLIRATILSDFAVGPMFLARARQMGDRTLFLLAPDRKEGRLSWAEVADRVRSIGRSLLALEARGEAGRDAPPGARVGGGDGRGHRSSGRWVGDVREGRH